MEFIELLKELQGEMTQGQLAERIGISQSALSRILNGQIKPSLELVVSITKAFPDRRDSILRLFFASDQTDTSDNSPIGIGNAA